MCDGCFKYFKNKPENFVNSVEAVVARQNVRKYLESIPVLMY